MTESIPAEQGSLLESEPAPWPEEAEGTGHAATDALLADELQELPQRPVDQHNAAYARLHDGLLAELDGE
jgi:hypothetical protein